MFALHYLLEDLEDKVQTQFGSDRLHISGVSVCQCVVSVTAVLHFAKEERACLDPACGAPRLHANERLDGHEIRSRFVFSLQL